MQHSHIFMPEEHMDKLYNSENSFVRFAHRNRLEVIAAFLAEKKEGKVLDAGCGEGHLIERLHQAYPSYEYYGYDITDVALDDARKRCPYARIEKKDILSLDVSDEFFDVVICSEVLEHIFAYKTAIGELKRVLKKQGQLILTFPNEINWTLGRFILGRRPIKVPDHVNSFSPRQIDTVVNMTMVSKKNLPFGLSFWFSLGTFREYEKR